MTGVLHTFVFADLAGFTALTEAHGDDRAADIAVEFCLGVNQLLPRGGQDLKMMGDACLLRLDGGRDAVTLGLSLTHELAARHGFLDVRVGMNTGTAVRRGQEWFGKAINVAARVAAVAGPGEVLLTDATLVAARGLPDVEFIDQGLHDLRHVTEPVRIHRARSAAPAATEASWLVDPVCHMRLAPEQTGVSVIAGGEFVYFCSPECAESFTSNPSRYRREPTS